MQFEELRFVCQSAAVDLVEKRARPLPPTVVLPGPERTRLLTLAAFPADDEQRHAYIAELARDEVRASEIPCWGFIAEGEADADDVDSPEGTSRSPVDSPAATSRNPVDSPAATSRDPIVVVVYGARRHAPELTASRFGSHGELEEFVAAEELDPTAMPFLHPLQHAVDGLGALEQPPDGSDAGGGLPLFP